MAITLDTPADQDLTTPEFWDDAWDARHQRLVSNWHSPRHRRKVQGLISLLSQWLDPCDAPECDVLELGCAPGGILASFQRARPSHRFHGLDYAPQGLAQTEAFFRAVGVPATLHCGDLREFDPPRRYDLVYSCGLIEHFNDPLPIVQHHARLCAPGGAVVVTVPNYAGPRQTWLIQRLHPEKLATHNQAIMNPDSLYELMSAASLENVAAGGFGRGKFSVSCQVRNPWTQVLRAGAKIFNAAQRVLPLAPTWHSTIWAAGRIPRDA